MLGLILALPVLVGLALAQAATAPVVDLGYAKYRGFYSPEYDQNIFNGIRYAAPPVGKLRWQLPQPPSWDRSQIFPAVDYAPQCPQSPSSPGPLPAVPSGDEDCLFLNVIAPANKKWLPVLVWIHGGGYGLGNNNYANFMPQVHTNGNSYVVVSIAYRLGAFGFLASADVKKNGVLNAAIHDMRFALLWIKQNIYRFGGDPLRVTISGESAGGGSVMMLAMANGGLEGDLLFQGLIPSSPYLPTQWRYDDTWPTLSYQTFVEQAGCSNAKSAFQCLQSADTIVLQNASAIASSMSVHAQWAFIPVTDGTLIRKRPSEQLLVDKRVNGRRVLTGNNGNEGPFFTSQNVTSEGAFVDFVLTNYPRLSSRNVTSVLELYAVPENVSGIYADSDGVTAPFSTTNSNWAVGWQQAANNLYAEATFVCPSYWLADAYGAGLLRSAWKYQYSPPISSHGADVGPVTEDPTVRGTGLDAAFRTAFQQTWGNFVVRGDPTLSAAQVSGAGRGDVAAAAAGSWPRWGGRPESDFMLNLNMTGGMPVVTRQLVDGKTLELTSYVPSVDGSHPELKAAFSLASGWSWEGGRGKRCQLWADLGRWALL
ncbi:putative carboxylesterase family protein [Rosellinia necatrix]|uniref:Carboxylic ester hydrolase n=1 Tax=Rosellinia necatrix TaxID=77044 RepID=A0A1S7UJQ4_ROSNE|nr:putative carboxylesterase family protein [Rosellinia necatrix]